MRISSMFRKSPKKTARLLDRVINGFAEVGLLLIAFGPLEAAINRTSLRNAAGFVVVFVGVGLLLFAFALITEWRWQDER
jgi:hypothetical protein